MTLLLTAALLAGAQGDQAPTEPRLMRYPTVHGNTVVFTYAADLWVSDLNGGSARRLTSHPGLELRARLSPDGKMVAFTGQYEGNNDAFVVPIEGGEPRRLTFEPETDNVIGWSPDGKIMVSTTAGSFTNRQQRLYLVDPDGGLPTRTKVMEIAEGSFTSDGSTLVYNRFASNQFNWRRYRGGSQGRISIFNLRTNNYAEIPAKREQSYFPMVVGREVYYISDKNQGTLNLYRYNLDTKREAQLTRYTDADIRFPSTDGKTIVFERDGYLYTYDIASGDAKRMNPLIRSDFVAARPMLRRTPITGMSISPTGVRVAVESRGEIYSVPARAGETRNLTNTDGARERFPVWSPDGRTIAYVSDASGHYEVYTQPQMGGTPTQLTTNAKLPINGLTWSPDSRYLTVATEANELHLLDVASRRLTRVFKARFGLTSYEFSPDSRWIAYINQTPNTFGALHLYEIATGRSTQVTEGRYDDYDLSWDLGGKYLYLISTRTFNPSFGAYEFSLKVTDAQRVYALPLTREQTNPLVAPGDEEPAGGSEERPSRPAGPPPSAGGAPAAPGAQTPAPPSGPPPIRIDIEGLGGRAIPLPMAAGNYPFVVGARDAVLYYSGGALHRFDMGSRESTPIATGAGMLSFNPNRTKMAYMMGGPGGGILGIVDVRPGVQPGQGRVDTSAVETVIDPRKEWRQIYWEAWRFVRNNFYDPGMVGQDWDAIGRRYEKYLPYVAHRADLNYVLGLMVGELGTGHSYVSGGDMGVGATPIPTGQLGADYEVVGNHVRFAKIYRGENFEEERRGPLGEPGIDVKEGDYLLAIDGRPVTRDVNPNSLLANKAGRTVILTVNSTPTMEGARRVRVRPLASEANLRYVDWVETNRRRVAEMSGGRIGYMHIPDTAYPGAIELIRGFYSQTDKDAMVVDERWNGGGLIQPWFVDTLGRRMRVGIQQRNAEDAFDAVAIEGPKVMLINGYAGSGGDLFPYMFRQSKLGPLVGTRTWGGLVGISGGAPLIDGGSVTAPEFALYDRESGEIIAENRGIDPDVEVDYRPDLAAQGRDPQLERGVAILMEQLRKAPPKKVRTRIPPVGREGRIGG